MTTSGRGMGVGELTLERLSELRRIAEAAAIIADADTEGTSGEQAASIMQYIATFDPPTVLAMVAEIERLRRERETLLSLLRQVDVVMDGAAMMGVGSIMAPRYRDDWAVVHTRVREHLALLDGEKGGDADE